MRRRCNWRLGCGARRSFPPPDQIALGHRDHHPRDWASDDGLGPVSRICARQRMQTRSPPRFYKSRD
jgi:hypothetical protein